MSQESIVQGRVCLICGEHKDRTEFHKESRVKDGIRCYCKTCDTKRCLNYRRRHQAKYDELVKPEEKQCFRCKMVQPATEFRVDRAPRDGLTNYCRTCFRYLNTAKKYGLSCEDMEQLYAEQDGSYAICHSNMPMLELHVDHDHKTGKVRGLLCHNCNTGLGHMKDDEDILLAAIDYLRENSEPPSVCA